MQNKFSFTVIHPLNYFIFMNKYSNLIRYNLTFFSLNANNKYPLNESTSKLRNK